MPNKLWQSEHSALTKPCKIARWLLLLGALSIVRSPSIQHSSLPPLPSCGIFLHSFFFNATCGFLSGFGCLIWIDLPAIKKKYMYTKYRDDVVVITRNTVFIQRIINFCFQWTKENKIISSYCFPTYKLPFCLLRMTWWTAVQLHRSNSCMHVNQVKDQGHRSVCDIKENACHRLPWCLTKLSPSGVKWKHHSVPFLVLLLVLIKVPRPLHPRWSL